MITVRRSDTGSFVLVHEPSQTVVVGDDLEASYVRMQELLRADPSLTAAAVAAPPSPAPRRGAWLVALGVLALLPFLWLAVLHYTLGRLVDDLRATTADVAPREETQALRAELETLRQVVSRVEDEVGQRRRGETPAAPRAGRPRRPAMIPHAADQGDEPEDDATPEGDATPDPAQP